MNLRRLLLHVLITLPLASGCLLAQAPGGIANPSRWLEGNFSRNSALLGSLNFNPAVRFDDPEKSVRIAHDHYDLRQATLFTVYQNNQPGREMPVWEMSGGFGKIKMTTQALFNDALDRKITFANPEENDANVPETVINTYIRSLGRGKAYSGADFEPWIRFGPSAAEAPDERFSGLIAEYILYEKILNEEERTMVESYLALKYGITIAKDYLSSAGKIVWDRQKNREYSLHIAGIARDDRATLYQKQGASSHDAAQPVIGVGQIAGTNRENTGQLDDQQYLVWGDNGQPFGFPAGGVGSPSEPALLARKWLMKVTGQGLVPTQLKIDVTPLLGPDAPADRLCLLIDRSGTGEFPAGSRTVIRPESVSPEGIACFSQIFWDTDHSGTDVFTLGLQPPAKPLPAVAAPLRESPAGDVAVQSFELFPNPTADGHYQLRVTLDKPADIEIRVFDLQQRLISTQKWNGQSEYRLPGFIDGAPGAYTVLLVTPQAEIPVKLIVEKQK